MRFSSLKKSEIEKLAWVVPESFTRNRTRAQTELLNSRPEVTHQLKITRRRINRPDMESTRDWVIDNNGLPGSKFYGSGQVVIGGGPGAEIRTKSKELADTQLMVEFKHSRFSLVDYTSDHVAKLIVGWAQPVRLGQGMLVGKAANYFRVLELDQPEPSLPECQRFQGPTRLVEMMKVGQASAEPR